MDAANVLDAEEVRALTTIPDRALSQWQQFESLPAAAKMADAVEVARVLVDVIDKCKLSVRIGSSEHVKVEGWTFLAASKSLSPQARTKTIRDDDKCYRIEAHVDLVDTRTGRVISTADAECDSLEVLQRSDGTTFQRWLQPDGTPNRNSIRSMAQTRATGKACRLALSWIVTLAGYEAIPAEEMEAVGGNREPRTKAKPKASAPDDDGGLVITDKQQKRMMAKNFAACERCDIPKDGDRKFEPMNLVLNRLGLDKESGRLLKNYEAICGQLDAMGTEEDEVGF